MHAGDYLRVFNLMHICYSLIDCFEVLLNNFLALAAVGFLDRCLNCRDSLISWQDAADGEETGLHNRVDAVSHSSRFCDFVSVDDIKPDPLGNHVCLHLYREGIPNFFWSCKSVQQEYRTWTRILEQIKAVDEAYLVASQETGFVIRNEIGGPDGVGTKAQVRNSNATRFFRVILEVTLGVVRGFFTNDFDRVFVGSNSTIGTKTIEHSLNDIVRQDLKAGIVIEAQIGNIVNDTNCEVLFGIDFCQFVENALNHSGSEIFGRQAIATTGDQRHCGTANTAVIDADIKSIDNVLV